MWHGILVDAAFRDSSLIGSFEEFSRKVDGDWTIIGVKVEDSAFEAATLKVQENLKKDNPFYVHFYKGEDLVVVFSEQIFRVKINKESWAPIVEYGKTLEIPLEQLDFWPHRLQDEEAYFKQVEMVR